MTEPQTHAQLVHAAAMADHLLDLVAEADYGLINAERCEDVLAMARARFQPAPPSADQTITLYVSGAEP